MLTPITCLTLVCDGCGTTAENDEGTFHFATANEAREWLAVDPHDDPQDPATVDPYRWHFGTDGTHLCPDCQCAAFGHVPRDPITLPIGPIGAELSGAFCGRCSRWLDLTPAPGGTTPTQRQEDAA